MGKGPEQQFTMPEKMPEIRLQEQTERWENRYKKLEGKIKNLPEVEKKVQRDEFAELEKIIRENGILKIAEWDEARRVRFQELSEKFKDIL